MRSVTESTKEIAIFRSFGARRLDIAAIYFSYSILLVTISFCTAVVLSYILMVYLNTSNIKYMLEYTLRALLKDTQLGKFSLISFPLAKIAVIYGITMIMTMFTSFCQ